MKKTATPITIHSKKSWFSSFLLVGILSVLSLSCSSLQAKSFTVRSGYDVADLTPGNGLCVAYLIINPPFVIPFCTLRAAIQETNALPGADTINLPSGTFHLTLEGANDDLAQTGDLDITEDLTIIGKGAGQTFISADELDRVLDVITPGVSVTIRGVSFINGKLPAGLPFDQQGGAGIRNSAKLTLINCSAENNSVAGETIGDSGAGLFNRGVCKISESTLYENSSENEGGAIYNAPGAHLIVDASTLYSNHALSGGGITNEGIAALLNTTISANQANRGAAIDNYAQITLIHNTVAHNTAFADAAINNSGEFFMTNTLLAANNGNNCAGQIEIISMGGNLDDTASCSMSTTDTDLLAVDPELAPLRENGGVTLTHRIYYSSPARDKALTLSTVTVDQRGHSRTVDSHYDIGAFEASLPMAPILDRILLVHDDDTAQTEPIEAQYVFRKLRSEYNE